MSNIYDLDNEYGARIIGDGGESSTGTLQVRSGAVGTPAINVGKTTVGSPTIAPLTVQHISVASGVVFGFGGGFISVTSILGTAATGAAIGFDYVIPVSLNGVIRGIPVTSLASLPGAAAF